jgi:hypothetical protein
MSDQSTPPGSLRCGVVLRVTEQSCELVSDGVVTVIPFAAPFPSPRIERVSAGHLVAIATAPDGNEVLVWRWYDAVVLGDAGAGNLLLWEPGHGEVIARPRSDLRYEPGSRAYASAGLPGADWWLAGHVATRPQDADVELDAVHQLYSEYGLWAAAFGQPSSAD